MKKVYIILAILLLAGAVGGYLAIPSEKEIAVVNYKEQVWNFDQNVYKSKEPFVKRFKDGDRSVDVINALVDIYVQEGNVNEAIAVLEAFVVEQPDNIEARKQLGTLYQYAQRPSDYLKNLEQIKALSGNKDVLRDLSDIYSFNEDYKKQAAVMNELIATKQPLEPRQFIELANLQAADSKPLEAISTLHALKEAHPDKVSYDAMRLLVSLLLDLGEKDKALAEAEWWKTKTSNMEEIAQLTNMLHFKGGSELANRYLESYGEGVFDYPDLVAEKVLIYITQGKETEAYEALNALDVAGTLPSGMIDTFLLLALRHGTEEQIATLTERITPDVIEEPQAISLVELAQSTRRNGLLNTIATQLGTPEYRQAHPLFSLVLGLALQEPQMGEKITVYLDENTVTDPQRVVLARSCAVNGQPDCTTRLINELSQGEMDNPRIAAVGNLYSDIHRYADGLAFIEKNRKDETSQDVEQIWVKLLAANGRREEVIDWLSKNEAQISEGLLADIYFLASDAKHHALALDAAKLLNAKVNTPQTRNYLAYAHLNNGQFEEALTLMKEAGELTDELVDSYLAALIVQAKRDPSYRDELASFASQQLASGQMSQRRKLALVYALIDGGRADIAMPYIRDFALRSGGDWAFIYAENLDKMGRFAEAREFWLLAAKRPGISDKEKRSIAFALLDKGYSEDAAALFMELAANADPDSKDVQQLLYVWGPRLDQSQVEWLYARAEAATDESKRKAWLKLVMDSASTEGITVLAAQHPQALQEPDVLESYLLANYDMRNESALDELLIGIKEGAYNEEAVRRYARFSRDYDMPRRSAEAYKQLLSMTDNKDEEALREIGIMAYGRADYSQAKDYLGNYLYWRKDTTQHDPEAYMAYFYYAEALRREQQFEESYKYYQATLDLIKKESVRTPEMESKAQQSMVWLGNVEGGMQGFREAIAQHPSDTVLHADYVSTLVEQKRYEDARQALKMPKPVMAESASSQQPLLISSSEFSAYRILANRRELLLAYNPVVTPKPSISESAPLSYEWISYVTQGQDQVLVAAKPDYTLEVVRRADGGMMVVPRRDEALASRRLEAQSRLRYELLNARIELETGEQYAASRRLNKLLPDYPDDSQLLGYTANAENYVGRWQRALKLLRRAHHLAPENEDIEILKRDIERLHAQHIKLDHEWRALGDSDEQITTLSGFYTVSEGMDIGVVLQNNLMDSATVRRADGRVDAFDEDKQRGEVFARYTDEQGATYRGSLFANNDTIGLGAYVDVINRLGITGLALEWQRPYWEFVEGVLDDATRDRAEIHHTARINQYVTVEADASVNRYNVADDSDVATSAGFGGTVAYQFMNDPEMAILYGLDAEYELDHNERVDAAGEAYRPFPFRSREVHSLALAGKYRFSRETYLDYLAGYGFDRLGGNGPIGELRLTHEITPDWEVQGRAFYGLGSGETDDDVSRLGVYLMYRY